MTVLRAVLRTIKTEIWWTVIVLVMVTMVVNVTSLSGPNVCMVKQKYNITKRVKYRAPMSVRTYEWCFAMPPRCSKWNTEMRDVTRLETEERTAEMAVCCPGYKLRDVSCVPHCPSGKTGQGCSEDCPPNKWGPSCVHDCKICDHGYCDATTGVCRCQDGWQGESCETSMTTTTAAAIMEQLLTTESTSTKTTPQKIPTINSNTITSTAPTTTATSNDAAPVSNFTPMMTKLLSPKEITPTTIATIPNTEFTSNSTRNSEESTPVSLTMPTTKSSIILSNTSIPTKLPVSTLNIHNIVATEKITREYKKATENYSNYNRTEEPSETSQKISSIKTAATTEPTFIKGDVEWTTLTPARLPTTTKAVSIHQVNTKISTALTTTVKSSTRKIPTTVRQTITTKPKAKEIWIKPAQKEPEHITAVMGDKRNEKSTINLISVISIAGGVMMAVITIAIIIVMLERCKKPRYEDVRKYNDIRMQVMIDKNDVPPPYVRSIFHTPLPDPPTSEKCHYQPISTLDRNLKQFMRPVVVQTISPLMLENFRGILECHYDHLPRRSQDMGTMQTRCSVAPSIDEHEELLPPPRIHSLTDSDIEAMKCEAKLDVIDNTTSEPLYAEIPCWRPPSAHAIEVVNLNGEAVTEL